nr:YciI family protein [Nakamurella endophytica]
MLLVFGFHDGPPEGAGAEPTVEEFQAYERSLVDAGVRVDGAALTGEDVATTVQVRADGRRLVANGPFAESREFLGGFVLIDVPDLDAAMDWAARCPGARYGRVEVRPLLQL